MSKYTVVYRDEGVFVDRDAWWFKVAVIKDRDSRIGACADTGHWVRSNLKPVECLRILKGRIVSSHLKDLNQMGPSAHDVPYGLGVSDVAGILDELKAQGFAGNLSIEYEYHWENSSPEIAESVKFFNSVCAGLATETKN